MGLFDALVGGGLAYLGSRQTAKSARSAAQQEADAVRLAAANAEKAAVPWSVGSLGGTAAFDKDKQAAILGLSPELSDIYSGALSRAGLWGGQATALGADPFEAANTFYERQEPYYTAQEDRLRTNLETRQLAQGRLGTTGGAQQFGDLERGLAEAQTARRNQAFSQAQGLVESLLGRESADIGQAVGLLDVPLQMANVGQKVGGSLGQAAAYGLQARQGAAQTLGMANAQSSMGSALGGLGGLFMDTARSDKPILG